VILAETKRISTYYKGLRAIEDIHVQVPDGFIVVMIGANGAGKSTVVNSIMGLVRPTKGEIWFDGSRIDNLETHRIAQLGIAIVPEGRRLFRRMSVLDNLLVGAHRRTGEENIKINLEEVYSMFPVLRKRAGQPAGSLSGGEQQMLAIGRALMLRPKLVLLDEPSLGLAPIIVLQIGETIRSLSRERGLTVLMVEQNARIALKIANYAYVLENGKIVLEGKGEDLLANDYIVRAYLGGE
jgi:branched-chain amino acid transport system ATP-binding protein